MLCMTDDSDGSSVGDSAGSPRMLSASKHHIQMSTCVHLGSVYFTLHFWTLQYKWHNLITG